MLHKTDKCISHVASFWVSCIRSTSMQKTTLYTCAHLRALFLLHSPLWVSKGLIVSVFFHFHSLLYSSSLYVCFAYGSLCVCDYACIYRGALMLLVGTHHACHSRCRSTVKSSNNLFQRNKQWSTVLIIWHADLYINTEVEMIKGYCRTTSVWEKYTRFMGELFLCYSKFPVSLLAESCSNTTDCFIISLYFLYVRNVSNLCLIVNETFNDLSVTFNFCLLVCREYVLMDVCKITLQSLKI